MIHDYFTQQDIINELKAEGIYITPDILLSFKKNKYVNDYKEMMRSLKTMTDF